MNCKIGEAKSSNKKLGNYIELVSCLNNKLQYRENDVRGVSNNKEIIQTRANNEGRDFNTFYIVKPEEFIYNSRTSRMGDKVGLGYNDTKRTFITSFNNTVFRVIDETLLPMYLYMWFNRPEFDRYVRFHSWGSSTEIFSWEEMCNVTLPIPDITIQKKIVKEYNVIQNRIALNQQLIQKLEETAQAIYRKWFVDGIDLENLPEGWRVGAVSDLCNYSSKRISIEQLNFENYISTENMLQSRGGVVSANNLPNPTNVTNFEIGNILISNIRPYFKKIWLANFSGGCSNDVLCLVPKNNIPSLYLYQILEKDDFFDYVMAGSKGTKMPRGDKKWIMNYTTVIPSKEILKKFTKTTQIIQNGIQLKMLENKKLTELKDLLLSKLATIEN